MSRCLYCYNILNQGEKDFHTSCSKKFFGQDIPPLLDLELKEIRELAIKILGKSISVTGVQPKLSLDLQKKKGKGSRLTLVGLFGNYILKPPFKEYPEMPEIEDLTMHLAQELKINTADHSLIRLKSGELAYISKRFDRVNNIKIHVEDMAQLTETLTENKYRGSIEKIGKIIKKFSSYSGLDMIKLFELTLFSFISGNTDMHLKNFSLISDEEEEIYLSPAYDLLSTLLLIPEDKEESALTINGKKNNLKKKDFDILAAALEIDKKALNKIYKRIEDTYPIMTEWIDKSFLSLQMKERYRSLLSGRMVRLNL